MNDTIKVMRPVATGVQKEVEISLDGLVQNSQLVSRDAFGKTYDSSATVVAAGSTVTDATALTAEYNYVTGANGAKGVVLPVAAADEEVVVVNGDTTAGNFLKVYAITGSQINALGSTVAFQLNPGQTATFIGRSAILWNTAAATDTITGLTATAAELNVLHSVVAGTAAASSGLVLGANKNVDTLAIADSGLKLGAGAGTAVTATAAQLNATAVTTAGTVEASKAVVAGAAKNVDTLNIALLSVGAAGIEGAVTAHSGGGQALAFALSTTKSFHDVTIVAAGNDSVALPLATGSGNLHLVKNSAAANSLQVFGSGTDTIDGIATGTGVAIAAGKARWFIDDGAGTWESLLGA